MMSVVNLFYGVTVTAKSELLQNELSSARRATMGSVLSLAAALSGALVYYLAGIIADVFSVRLALLTLVAVKAGGSSLCLFVLKSTVKVKYCGNK